MPKGCSSKAHAHHSPILPDQAGLAEGREQARPGTLPCMC